MMAQWILALIAIQFGANFKKNSFALIGIAVLLIISVPAFEDDHIRYFFEGRKFLEGKNIYLVPPRELFENADWIQFKDLKYNDVPSVYGPVAHLYHGILDLIFGSFARQMSGLIFMLILFLWRRETYFFLLVPFLTKEFINSIHIDLLAIFLFIVGVKLLITEKLCGHLMIILSLLTKISGVIFIPFLVLRLFGERKDWRHLLFLPIYIFVFTWNYSLPGMKIFIHQWSWNPGLIYRFWDDFNAPSGQLVLVGIVLTTSICLLKKGNWFEDLGIIALSFIFFSKVVNSWYLAWPALFFMFGKKCLPIVWIAIAWPLCYLPWFNLSNWEWPFHVSGLVVLFISMNKKLLSQFHKRPKSYSIDSIPF